MHDDVIGGYGRGQYTARQPVPGIIVAAAWVIVLLGGPLLVAEILTRISRVGAALVR